MIKISTPKFNFWFKFKFIPEKRSLSRRECRIRNYDLLGYFHYVLETAKNSPYVRWADNPRIEIVACQSVIRFIDKPNANVDIHKIWISVRLHYLDLGYWHSWKLLFLVAEQLLSCSSSQGQPNRVLTTINSYRSTFIATPIPPQLKAMVLKEIL